MDAIWIIGDEFGLNQFNKFYYEKPDTEECYMKDTFEIVAFMNNKDLSYDENILNRFRNNLIGAITDQKVLLKIIVIVTDNDILRYFWYKNKDDVQTGYTRLLKWLMSQYDRMILTQKEFLPKKSHTMQTNLASCG